MSAWPRPDPPTAAPADRYWRVLKVVAVMIAAALVILGLALVAFFVIIVVGLSQWGSNK